MMLKIAVSIIEKGVVSGVTQNNPLHIQPLQDGAINPLKFDYIVYVSMDAIDSILAEQAERSMPLGDLSSVLPGVAQA
jgi:hypothetical protein